MNHPKESYGHIILNRPLGRCLPKKPVFDFRAHFCHSAPMETHAFGFRLRPNAPRAKNDFLSVS